MMQFTQINKVEDNLEKHSLYIIRPSAPRFCLSFHDSRSENNCEITGKVLNRFKTLLGLLLFE